MPVALSSLRVEASLDAAQYVAGARAKADADTAMVKGADALNTSLEATERRLSQSGTAVERLAKSIDPAYQAQRRLEAGTATLQRALDAGTITTERHAELVRLLNERYDASSRSSAALAQAQRNTAVAANENVTAFRGLSNAAKLSYTDMEILRAGVINTVQSLAAGESAVRTFQTQLFQTAPALGGVTRALGLTTAALVPIAGGLIAAAAVVGTFIAATVRLADTQQNIKLFQLELDALGESGRTNGIELQKAFEALRDSGTSAAEALMVIQQVTRNPLINQARTQEITFLARDIASLTGDTLPEANQKLTAALSGGVDAVIKYGLALNALSANEAAQIRQTGDLNIAINRLHAIYDGAKEAALGPFGRAVEDITKKWNELLDALSHSVAVTFLLDQIRGVIYGIKTSIEEIDRIYNAVKKLGTLFPGAGENAVATAPLPPAPSAGNQAQVHPNAGAAPGAEQAITAGGSPPLPAGFTPRFGAPVAGAPGLPSTPPPTVAGATSGMTANAINEQAEAYNRLNDALRRTGAAQQGQEAYYRALDEARAKGIEGTDRETYAANARNQAFAAAGIEFQKQIEEAARLREGTLSTADAFITSEAAGIRMKAAVQAAEEVFQRFGDLQGRNAELLQRTNAILEQQSVAAIEAAEQQARAFDRTITANKAFADASAQSTAALKEAQIVNAAAVETQDAYAKALAAGDPALIARAEALQRQAEAQIRANQAAQESTQVNERANQIKDDTALAQLQATLQGQTSEEIQKQVLLLRTKQDLEGRFSNASDEAKQNLIAQTDALANANIKLGEARAAEGRLSNEIRSVADTIINSIGSALDEVLSGKKISDWGQLFRDTLRSIASTLIQSEFVKPLIGSGLQALGLTAAGTPYGALRGSIFEDLAE